MFNLSSIASRPIVRLPFEYILGESIMNIFAVGEHDQMFEANVQSCVSKDDELHQCDIKAFQQGIVLSL